MNAPDLMAPDRAPTEPDAVPPASLSVSIVTYRPDIELLAQTIGALAAAIVEAERSLLLSGVSVALIDNTGPRESMNAIRHAVGTALAEAAAEVDYRHGQGNVGYGRAHNLALLASRSDFHLVLNPDVIVDRFALVEAIRFMRARGDVVLLAPAVSGPDGTPQFLAKRFPALLDLALRGFAPAFVRERFRTRLDRYELRDRVGDRPLDDVEVASGCCMFLRREAAKAVGGFDPSFFLYFEDFDLSLRLRRRGRIAFVPQVKIVHFGGFSARKGWRHIALFAGGAARFYRKHGWRLT